MEIVLVLFLIGAVVFNYVHELGHLWVAKMVNIGVDKAYLGVGPIFHQVQGRGNTQWLYGYLPVASVHFNTASYQAAAPFRRLLAASGGPLANFAATFLLLALAYVFYPASPPPVLTVADSNGVAAVAGLQSGDRITHVDGKQTRDWQAVGDAVLGRINDTGVVQLSVLRGDTALDYEIPIENWQYRQAWVDMFDALGVLPQQPESAPPGNPVGGVARAMVDTVKFGFSTAEAGFKMVFGSMSIANFVGGLQLTQLGLHEDGLNFGDYLKLMALFSMCFGIINMLPGPVVDGLQMLTSAGEWIAGRALPAIAEKPVFFIGVVLAFGPLPLCFIHDLIRFT